MKPSPELWQGDRVLSVLLSLLAVPAPDLNVGACAHPIVVDGDLAEWGDLPPASNSVERVPMPGQVAPVATDYWACHTADAVFVGVRMANPIGEGLRADEFTRDSFRIYSGDALSLKFDVRADQRTSLVFAVNPAGAKLDYISLDNGRVRRVEYDAVWDAATATSERGWQAEFEISADALGLAPVEGERLMGFNLSRDHNARLATYDWSPMPPEFGAVSAPHYGTWRGMQDMRAGSAVTLLPFARAVVPGDAPAEASVGGDLRTRLGDDVWLGASILPDFAEVDLDDQAVSLTRDPLFFPEKRPFFLSGLDVFTFGSSGRSQLFFSRRLGIEDGEEVPVFGAAKVYGRHGPLSFGVLDVVTEGSDDPVNWSVARVRYNSASSSYVGLMATARAAEETDAALGSDFAWYSTDKRFLVNGFGSVLLGDTNPVSFGAEGRYKGAHWQPSVSTLWVDEEFDPVMGFVQRQGVLRSSVSAPWIRRFKDGALQSYGFTVGAGGDQSIDDWDVTRQELSLRGEATTRGGTRYALWSNVGRDRGGFGLVDAQIPDGDHPSVEFGARFDTSFQRNPYFGASLVYQPEFWRGRRLGARLTGGFTVGPYFRFSLTGNLSLVDLPDVPQFPIATINSAATIALSPEFYVDLLANYRRTAWVPDGATGDLLDRFLDDTARQASLRLRYIYAPGSNLFVVYREAHDGDEHRRQGDLKLIFRWDV